MFVTSVHQKVYHVLVWHPVRHTTHKAGDPYQWYPHNPLPYDGQLLLNDAKTQIVQLVPLHLLTGASAIHKSESPAGVTKMSPMGPQWGGIST